MSSNKPNMSRRSIVMGGATVLLGSSAEGQSLLLLVSSYALYDNFSRYADNTAMAGQIPLVGPSWSTSGVQLPTISGGKLVAPSASVACYLYNILGSHPLTISAELDFTGGSNLANQGMTIAFCNDVTFTISNALHLNFGPLTFTLSIRQSAGSFVQVLSDSWPTPMSNDGTTNKVSLSSLVNKATVTGGGGVWSLNDPRISGVAGPTVFWEPGTQADGLKAEVSKAYTLNDNVFNYTNYAPFNPADLLNITLSENNWRATAATNAAADQVRTVLPNANNLVYFEVNTVAIFNPASQLRIFGISTASHSFATVLGNDAFSCGWYVGATASFNFNSVNTSVATGGTMQAANGDKLAFVFDFNLNKSWFKNITKGTGWNNDVIGNQNPATGTGGQSFAAIGAGPYYITFCLEQISDSFRLNTGQLPYAGAVPVGISNWTN